MCISCCCCKSRRVHDHWSHDVLNPCSYRRAHPETSRNGLDQPRTRLVPRNHPKKIAEHLKPGIKLPNFTPRRWKRCGTSQACWCSKALHSEPYGKRFESMMILAPNEPHSGWHKSFGHGRRGSNRCSFAFLLKQNTPHVEGGYARNFGDLGMGQNLVPLVNIK